MNSKQRAASAQFLYNQRRELYKRDPLLWYEERFKGKRSDIDWTEFENYDKHEWDGTPNPFKTMFETLASWGWVAIESATSTGKTYMLPRVIYWFLDCFENSLVVTTAPKQSQLKNVLWSEIAAGFKKFKRIRPRAEMYSMRVVPDGTTVKFGTKFDKSLNLEDLEDDDYSEAWHAIGVVAGVRADEESATKMQGFHREHMLIIIEECAGVPLPVLTAVKNTSTGDKNIILAVGNPDSQLDALHQFAILEHVQHIRISAFDHPNIVTGKSLIPGAVTQKSIDIRRVEYGEHSNLYRSRVRGIAPKQAVDALIHYDWIQECNVNDPEHFADIELDINSYNALGIDVANSEGGDAACLAWGKQNECWWLHEFQCPNANDLAFNVMKTPGEVAAAGRRFYQTGQVMEFNIQPWNIGVDAVGVGAGTVNEFDNLGYSIQSLQGGCDEDRIPKDAEGKPLYKFRSLRAQMYFQARLDLQNHKVRINIPQKNIFNQLAKELSLVTYHVTDGYMVIESKEDIKAKLGGKSPNLADAFVYWNWVRTANHYEAFAHAPIG